ncbi:MAG: hypothetical protein JWO05_60 [Gemmatimonadetes bacterium]|nr:hypothetical protein [Gemmatimonadota bacterium]
MKYAALFVVLGAGALGAQDARLARRLDAPTQAAVLKLIDVARSRGLPTEPLVEKALEGATKRAPREAIERALTRRMDRLQLSRETLGAASSDADVAAGATALEVGVPTDAIRDLRAIRPTRSVAVPLAVLAELVAHGVPVAKASQMVAVLMRRGVSEGQLVALGRDVQGDIATGASPEASLDVRTRYLVAMLPVPGANNGLVNSAIPSDLPRKP